MSLKWKPTSRSPQTAEEIKELIKCGRGIKGFYYWVENYAKVLVPRKGYVNIKLYPKQKKVIEALWNEHRVIVLKSRQIGITTVLSLFSVWATIFYKDYSVGILSKAGKEASKLLDKMRGMIEVLPPWMVIPPVTVNRQEVVFTNGSKLVTSSASKDAFRGDTLNLLIIDEAAAAYNISEFYRAASITLSQNFSKVQDLVKKEGRYVPFGMAIISTAAVLNNDSALWFYNMWTGAENGENNFVPVKIHWREVPFYDKSWYEEQKKVLNNDPVAIATELDCEFVIPEQDRARLLTHSELKKLKEATEPYKRYFKDLNYYLEVTGHEKIKDRVSTDLKFFKHIDEIRKMPLIIGVDPATGDGADYFAIQGINAVTGEQLFEFNKVAGRRYVLNFVLNETFWDLFYKNTILIVIERTGIGAEIIKDFETYTYVPLERKLFRYPKAGEPPEKWKIGFPTGGKNRNNLFMALIELVKEYINITETVLKTDIIHSPRLVSQLFAFKRNPRTGRLEAAKGAHDDLVLSFALAAYGKITADTLGLVDKVYISDEVKRMFNQSQENYLKIINGLVGEELAKLLDPEFKTRKILGDLFNKLQKEQKEKYKKEKREKPAWRPPFMVDE